MCWSVGCGEAASGKYPPDDVVLQKSDELISWEGPGAGEGGSFLCGQQSQVKTGMMKRYPPRGVFIAVSYQLSLPGDFAPDLGRTRPVPTHRVGASTHLFFTPVT